MRRNRLFLFFLSVVAPALLPVAVGADEPVEELRAVWLTWQEYVGKTETQLRETATNLRNGGVNTVYMSVYSNQRVMWPSKVYEAAGGGWYNSTMDRVDFSLDVFHDEGLKVGAFFEYGLAVGYITHPIAVAHPDWLARNINGEAIGGGDSLVFLSPGNMEAMQFVEDLLAELAANYDFDDIQFDRFRWASRDYGYEEASASLFEDTYGYPPPADPDDSRWVRFRKVLVNRMADRCHDRIKAINPEICISSAPTAAYMMEGVLQDWVAWANQGSIDVAITQMYFTNLSGFQWEFDVHTALAGEHVDKMAIGFWGSETYSHLLVKQQMEYAKANGVPHATLWVYHHYEPEVIAIQDELDHLPLPGYPWELEAVNPFVSEKMVQIIVDNLDGGPAYDETGSWSWSGSDEFFRLNSRETTGANGQSVSFSADVPMDGLYDVFAWYATDDDRNDQAVYTVHHGYGTAEFEIDQRVDGGQWLRLGDWFFRESDVAPRVTLSTVLAEAGEVTSADAVKIVRVGPAAGDHDDNGVLDLADFEALVPCLSGAGAGVEPGCEIFDFDRDGTMDLRDFSGFQIGFEQP